MMTKLSLFSNYYSSIPINKIITFSYSSYISLFSLISLSLVLSILATSSVQADHSH